MSLGHYSSKLFKNGWTSPIIFSLFFINIIGEAWILIKEYFKNGKLGTFFADQALYFGVTVVIAALSLYEVTEYQRWKEALGDQLAVTGFPTSSGTGVAVNSVSTYRSASATFIFAASITESAVRCASAFSSRSSARPCRSVRPA